MHTEGDLDLMLEAAWPAAVVDQLKRVGYAVKPGAGATLSAIERDPATGKLESAMR
jgi:hypothetical protein